MVEQGLVSEGEKVIDQAEEEYEDELEATDGLEYAEELEEDETEESGYEDHDEIDEEES